MEKYLAPIYGQNLSEYWMNFFIGGFIIYVIAIRFYIVYLKKNNLSIFELKSHFVSILIVGAFLIFNSFASMQDNKSVFHLCFAVLAYLVILIELMIALIKSLKKYKLEKKYNNLLSVISISIVFIYIFLNMISKIVYFFN